VSSVVICHSGARLPARQEGRNPEKMYNKTLYHHYYVYILASERNGTLYVGMTNNLIKRVSEHKDGKIEGFTKKYKVNKLVYYEYFDYVNDAITREKRIKEWKREWKLKLIEKENPNWRDLYDDLY
jgi:putative endonuclease